MKITDALLGEHDLFYAYFGTLATRMEAGDHAGVRVLATSLVSLLRAHALAEDELLFPALDGVLGDGGPPPVMRDEHAEIDGLLDEIKTADTNTQAAAVMAQLLDLVYGHFDKEEEVPFPMAEQLLDADVLTDLGLRWAKRRRVTLAAA